MHTLILRHRTSLDRWLRLGGLLSVAVVVLGAVLRRGDWPAQRFLLFYVAPLFAFGAAWALDRLQLLPSMTEAAAGVDACAFLLGALRVAGGWGVLPYSGHMLFLTYAVLTPGSRSLRFIALLLIATTTVFKLLLWHDPTSWSVGIVGGLLLAAVRAMLVRRGGGLIGASADLGA